MTRILRVRSLNLWASPGAIDRTKIGATIPFIGVRMADATGINGNFVTIGPALPFVFMSKASVVQRYRHETDTVPCCPNSSSVLT